MYIPAAKAELIIPTAWAILIPLPVSRDMMLLKLYCYHVIRVVTGVKGLRSRIHDLPWQVFVFTGRLQHYVMAVSLGFWTSSVSAVAERMSDGQTEQTTFLGLGLGLIGSSTTYQGAIAIFLYTLSTSTYLSPT